MDSNEIELSKLKFFNFSKAEVESIFSKMQLVGFTNLNDCFCFLKIDADTYDNRLLIRKVINREEGELILVSNDAKIASLAWNIQAFYFMDEHSLDMEQQFKNILTKISSQNNKHPNNRLAFKSINKIDVISPKEITFILANGNYSTIYLKNKQEVLVTKQIGKITMMIEPHGFLQRFGKSTILNLNQISGIKNKTIHFYNGAKLNFPNYSKGFNELMNKLIWK